MEHSSFAICFPASTNDVLHLFCAGERRSLTCCAHGDLCIGKRGETSMLLLCYYFAHFPVACEAVGRSLSLIHQGGEKDRLDRDRTSPPAAEH